MQIARIDEKTRTMWFGANGREKGQDPYFTHFYRIGLDGKNYVSLTPDDGTHTIAALARRQVPRSTRTRSPTSPPVVDAARRATGKLVMPLEKADISKLLATGWKPPMPIKMKAADGKTDIYGLLFRPTNFDPTQEVSDHQPGVSRVRRRGSIGSRAFTAARGDRQALAELGFVVVTHRRHAARRAGRSRSTTRTTARWAATTRFPIRSPA